MQRPPVSACKAQGSGKVRLQRVCTVFASALCLERRVHFCRYIASLISVRLLSCCIVLHWVLTLQRGVGQPCAQGV